MSVEEQASSEVKRFRIYTKTGDSGTTSLYNGQRLPKDDDFFHALGHLDELNSAIGIVREFVEPGIHLNLGGQLEIIQSRLLDVGSAIATPITTSSKSKLERTRFDEANTATLEKWIDQMDTELPSLKNFILPSGGKAASFLHLARAVARRAERSVVLLTKQDVVDPQVAIYLNRLSDYLFTAARFAAQREGKPETIYQKP